MVPEEIGQQKKLTPEVAEKKVSAAVDDIVEDEDFVIEEDGDFFWVIQRISWGIIKTLLVVAVLGLLIWLIWGGKLPSFGGSEPAPASVTVEVEAEKPGWLTGLFKKNETKIKEPIKTITPEPDTTPVVTTPTKPPIAAVEIVNDLNLEALAYQLAAENLNVSTGSSITETTQWLREVKNVGDISTELLRLSAPANRAERIESTIRRSEELLNESSVLQRQLSEEFNYFFNLGQADNQRIAALDNQIAASLSQFQGVQVETLLAQKISAQQSASGNLSQAKVRQTLLQNVQNFDRLLRQKSIPLLRPTEFRANPK